jgi:hypothetical protein
MKVTKLSDFALWVTISTGLAAALTIVINWLSLFVSGKPLNSSGYYIVLFTLSGATMVFGLFVGITGFLEVRAARRKRSIEFVRTESEADKTDIGQRAVDDLMLLIDGLYPSQRYELMKRLERDASNQPSAPIKVTTEIKGTPITIDPGFPDPYTYIG